MTPRPVITADHVTALTYPSRGIRGVLALVDGAPRVYDTGADFLLDRLQAGKEGRTVIEVADSVAVGRARRALRTGRLYIDGFDFEGGGIGEEEALARHLSELAGLVLDAARRRAARRIPKRPPHHR